MSKINDLKEILETTKENIKLMMMTDFEREEVNRENLMKYNDIYAPLKDSDNPGNNNSKLTSNQGDDLYEEDFATSEPIIEENPEDSKNISVKVNLRKGEIVVDGYLPVFEEVEKTEKLERVKIIRPFRGIAANGMYTKTYDKSEIRQELQLNKYVKEYLEAHYGKSDEENAKSKDDTYLKEKVESNIRKNFSKNFDMGVYKTLIDYDMRKFGSPINNKDSYTYNYVQAISEPVTRKKGESLRDYKIRKDNTIMSRLKEHRNINRI